jgi:hypothetical protein
LERWNNELDRLVPEVRVRAVTRPPLLYTLSVPAVLLPGYDIVVE